MERPECVFVSLVLEVAEQIEVMDLRHVRREQQQLLHLALERQAARRQLAQALLHKPHQLVHVLFQLRRGQQVLPWRRGCRRHRIVNCGLLHYLGRVRGGDPLAKVRHEGAQLLKGSFTER